MKIDQLQKIIFSLTLLQLICGCKQSVEDRLKIPEGISPAHFSGLVANSKSLWPVSSGCVQHVYEDPPSGPVIVLTKGGEMLNKGSATTLVELKAVFGEMSRKWGTDLPVFLWADQDVSITNLSSILKTMHAVGLYKLNLGGLDQDGQPVYRRLFYLTEGPIYPPGDGYNYFDIREAEKLKQVTEKLASIPVEDKLVIITKESGEQEDESADGR